MATAAKMSVPGISKINPKLRDRWGFLMFTLAMGFNAAAFHFRRIKADDSKKGSCVMK